LTLSSTNNQSSRLLAILSPAYVVHNEWLKNIDDNHSIMEKCATKAI